MNDKDKEAFEKWFKDAWDIDFDGYDFRHTIQVKAWQAACKYKQKEIDENNVALDSSIYHDKKQLKQIEKLQSENSKLKECVEFYADTNNWDAADGVHDSIISGVITGADHYEPWGNTGIAVGGKLARQTLKELKEID